MANASHASEDGRRLTKAEGWLFYKEGWDVPKQLLECLHPLLIMQLSVSFTWNIFGQPISRELNSDASETNSAPLFGRWMVDALLIISIDNFSEWSIAVPDGHLICSPKSHDINVLISMWCAGETTKHADNKCWCGRAAQRGTLQLLCNGWWGGHLACWEKYF
jgi:hypothetical protein